MLQVLAEKCGAQYTGVCSRFLTDSDTLDRLMSKMDAETFTDVASRVFDFVEREANRGYNIMQHQEQDGRTRLVSSVHSSFLYVKMFFVQCHAWIQLWVLRSVNPPVKNMCMYLM